MHTAPIAETTSKINSLKEFEIADLSQVTGGLAQPGLTVEITGVLDGIKHNTAIKLDATL